MVLSTPTPTTSLSCIQLGSFLALYIRVYIKEVKCYTYMSSISLSFCFKIHGKISFLPAVLSLSPGLCLRSAAWFRAVCLPLKENFSHFTYFLIFYLNHPEGMSRITDENGKDEKMLKLYSSCPARKDRIVGERGENGSILK